MILDLISKRSVAGPGPVVDAVIARSSRKREYLALRHGQRDILDCLKSAETFRDALDTDDLGGHLARCG